MGRVQKTEKKIFRTAFTVRKANEERNLEYFGYNGKRQDWTSSRPDFESPLCDGIPRQPLHEKGKTDSWKDLQEIYLLNTELEDGLVLE